MFIGQEFSDCDTYVKTGGKVERYEDRYEYPSNQNLADLFKVIGYDIGHPCCPNKEIPIFFTNAVMGLKTPPVSANFKTKWLRESGDEFLVPLVKIINQQIIITMGTMATLSVSRIYNFKFKRMKDIICESPIIVAENRVVFPVYHNGCLGLRNRMREFQIQDWRRRTFHLKSIIS